MHYKTLEEARDVANSVLEDAATYHNVDTQLIQMVENLEQMDTLNIILAHFTFYIQKNIIGAIVGSFACTVDL